MTVLQQYLATIGVINVGGTGGGKGAASKMPALGSAYPSSSGSHFFSHHSMTAAAMGPQYTRAISRGGSAVAAAAPLSPVPSEQQQHYDEDEEMYDDQQQQHYMMMMHQQYAPGSSPEYEGYEAQQYAATRLLQHKQLQQQQSSYAYGDSFEVDDQGMTEADAAEGAAAGLLQLARAALLHLEEDEETDEGCGGLSSQHQQVHQSCAADEDLLQVQLQQQHLGTQHGQAKGSASWLRLELQAQSEESEKTAEEEDGEGSPMMAAQLQVHMMPRIASSAGGKRSTSGTRTAQAEAASNASSKRHRSLAGAATAAVTAAAITRASTEGGHGPFAFLRGAHGSSCSSLGGGKVRPVLDVSKPMSCPSFTTGFGSTIAAAATAAEALGTSGPQAPEPHSPAATGGSNNSSPAGNAAGGGVAPGGQALLAFMMSAFMGAAHGGSASSSSAAALSPSHLAAIARAMALSALSGPGLADSARHHGTDGPSTDGCLAVDCTAAASAALPNSPGAGMHSPAAKGSAEGNAAAASGLPSPGSAMSDMSAVLTALTREGSGVQQSSAAMTAPSTPLWPSLLEQQLKAVAAAAASAASVAAAHQ
jgi:hypothetical protein